MFGMTSDKIPLGAQFIAAANWLDIDTNLLMVDTRKSLATVRMNIDSKRGTVLTETVTDSLLSVLDLGLLYRLRDENVDSALDKVMPEWNVNLPPPTMMRLAEFMARIADYKSKFTFTECSK